jgi:hypothetical protein
MALGGAHLIHPKPKMTKMKIAWLEPIMDLLWHFGAHNTSQTKITKIKIVWGLWAIIALCGP